MASGSESSKHTVKKGNDPRVGYSLVPDFMFGKFDDIDVDFLRSIDVRSLIIDIDNTLAPYEVPEPDERTREWFAALAEAGIGAALVSNNERERVERFNRKLCLPA